MGWNFRRSMTLCKGVRLNFGKNGMSVSSGVKGFRKTYNLTTGQKTTTFGIPGTGIYYTSREGGKRRKMRPTLPVHRMVHRILLTHLILHIEIRDTLGQQVFRPLLRNPK